LSEAPGPGPAGSAFHLERDRRAVARPNAAGAAAARPSSALETRVGPARRKGSDRKQGKTDSSHPATLPQGAMTAERAGELREAVLAWRIGGPNGASCADSPL
jgi:hypothetical protein